MSDARDTNVDAVVDAAETTADTAPSPVASPLSHTQEPSAGAGSGHGKGPAPSDSEPDGKGLPELRRGGVMRTMRALRASKVAPEAAAVERFKSGADFFGCGGSWWHHNLALWFQRLRDHTYFQVTVVVAIVAAGILVGINTYSMSDDSTKVIAVLDDLVLAVFIAELIVKLVAEGSRPWHFFTNSWNVFDFFIVAVSFAPFGGGAVVALRLVRLMRVLKLVRALPKLRVLAMALLYSMSSIVYIGMLLGLLFYFYAVVGVSFFGSNDPYYFGSLHVSVLTLFRVATLEDWVEIMNIQLYGCDKTGYTLWPPPEDCTNPERQPKTAVVYFVSFVILANMMVLNLFIGIISGSMAEARNMLEEEMKLEQQRHIPKVNSAAIQVSKSIKLRNVSQLLLMAAHGLSDVKEEQDVHKADVLMRVDTMLSGCITTSNPRGMRTLSRHLNISRKSSQESPHVPARNAWRKNTWRSVARTVSGRPTDKVEDGDWQVKLSPMSDVTNVDMEQLERL